MAGFYNIARSLLFRMDAERAHNLTLQALKTGLMPSIKPIKDPALRIVLWERNFPNPVGIAAGFDKNAEIVTALFKMGFGFVETGTVTPRPQYGNPKPRVFRDIEREAVINRMGFPNCGMNRFKQNLQKFLDKKPRPSGSFGINIGMNKSQTEPTRDYCLLVRQLGPLADYLTVNISSPNTPGLRDLQKRDTLISLTEEILKERNKSCPSDPPPLLVKLAPDLDEGKQEELAQFALESGIDGLILTNTTLDRPDYLPGTFREEKGGLSGTPLQDKSTQIIRNFYRLTKGKVPIIGLGGINSGEAAYEKIRAGASLVQLYTGLIYHGPGLINDINKSLLDSLQKDGFSHISQATGADHNDIKHALSA